VPLAVLLQTSQTSAEAVVARLERERIEAVVIDEPHWIARLVSFGTYRVRVAVPEERLAEARAALARQDEEARPRLNALAREVQRALLVASLPALALGIALALLGSSSWIAWTALLPLWIGGLALWSVLSRARAKGAGAQDG